MHVAMHVNTGWEHARSDLLMIRSLWPDFKYWPHRVTANHDNIGPYYECGERQTLLQRDMVNVAPRTSHDHSSSLQHARFFGACFVQFDTLTSVHDVCPDADQQEDTMLPDAQWKKTVAENLQSIFPDTQGRVHDLFSLFPSRRLLASHTALLLLQP